MFDVFFFRDAVSPWRRIAPMDGVYVARSLQTIEAARDARQVSGDIVVHAGTSDVVQDYAWLWDWEQPDSYALRAIEAQKLWSNQKRLEASAKNKTAP